METLPLTTYHPDSDEQRERMNAILECHLRSYGFYLQDDRVEWLTLAEFSAKSIFSETSRIAPSLARHGFQPQLDIEPYDHSIIPASHHAESVASDMKSILDHLEAEIALAQSRYEEAANRSLVPASKSTIGQEVWLSARNFKTLCPKKKPDWKYVVPFKVVAVDE
jgi:hypothetical protein